MLYIRYNFQTLACTEGTHLLQFLLTNSLLSDCVDCILVNRKVIPHDQWAAFELKEGDLIQRADQFA